MRYTPAHQTRPSANNGPGFWLVALVGLIIWTLLMWFAYYISDAVIVWISGNGPALAETGKSLIGKEATALLDVFKLDQVAGSGIGLLHSLLVPAFWIIWAIGAIAILFIRSVLARIIAMRGSPPR